MVLDYYVGNSSSRRRAITFCIGLNGLIRTFLDQLSVPVRVCPLP